MSYIDMAEQQAQARSQPTSASQWRKNRDKSMILPSDNVMQLRRVGLMDLIAVGKIPTTLSAMAAQVASKARIGELSTDELKEYANVVNLVTQACAVEPRVGPESSDDTLAFHEVDFVDKTAIFNWANGAANALRPFRRE